jgi:LPXTG-motif cell wall-anchored protein
MLISDCSNVSTYQFFDLDVTNGDATPIGTPTVLAANSRCSSNGAIDPTDGTVYYIAWPFGPAPAELVTLDPETGISQKVAELSGASAYLDGIGIDADGHAFGQYQSHIYSLDLATGVTTDMGNTGLPDENAFAYNPVDQKFYWFTEQGPNSSNVYIVDPLTATATLVTPALDLSALNGFHPDGLTFDSNGIAWLQDDNCDGPNGNCGIEAVNLVTGEVWAPVFPNDTTLTVHAANFNGKGYFYTMGLFFIPGPVASSAELPNTGFNSVMFSGLAAGLALVGLAGVIIARRRAL